MTRLPKTASALAVSLALALVSACDRVGDVTTPSLGVVATPPAALIGGNPHFSFLPPIAQRAPSLGELDASLSPVVEICEWSANACVLPLVSRLTDVDVQEDHYGVNWHTNGLALNPAKMYRLRVLVAGTELGSADVDVVKNGADARSVDASRYVALVAGRTLPIKFRIEQGAVWVIGAAGGSISAMGGQVQLDVPAGALPGDVGITVQPTNAAHPAGGFLVADAMYEFGPHGVTFGAPVQVTIAYDVANLPPGREEHELRLLHFTGGQWEAAAGSLVNTQANTVTGAVTSFSPLAPGGGSVITLSALGTAIIDGTMNVLEWANADCRNYPINLPTGGTTTATLCVMNDATNLYIGFKFAQSALADFNFFDVLFDNKDDGPNKGDDWLATQINLTVGTTPLFMDWFATVGPDTAPPCPANSICADSDNFHGGTEDGAGAFTNSGGLSTYEMSHPLDSKDTLDFSLTAGQTVGFYAGLHLSNISGGFGFTGFPALADHGHILIAGGVDQQQPTIDVSVGGLAIGWQSNQMLAQVVTAGVSGKLSEVQFPVACDNGTLIVEIQGVANGQPNGVVLASESIAPATLPHFPPNPPTFRGIVFSTPALVTAGSQFAIIMKNPTGGCGVFQGPVGDPYLGGDAFYDAGPNQPGVWLPLSGTRRDLPFQTVVN